MGSIIFIGALASIGAAEDSADAGMGLALLALLAVSFFGFMLNVAMILFGIYLLRGRGETPGAARRREAAERAAEERDRQKQEAAEERDRQKQEAAALREKQARDAIGTVAASVAAATGGAALVAYRSLQETAQQWYPQGHESVVSEAISAVGVDLKSLDSPRLGHIETLTRGSIEVFQDWIICGDEAHDVDASTQGHLYQDGSVQVAVARDSQNRVVQGREDMRTAEIQFLGTGWSMSRRIHPDRAIDAKKLIAMLESHVATLRSRGLTQADLREMVDAILNNTGQPAAEKLKQLSNLRFDRLLSDEEYEKAKSKILGLN